MNDFAPIIVSAVTYAIVEIFKRVDAIPVQEGQKNKLRLIASVLSFVGAGLMAFSANDFSSFGTPELAQALSEGLVAFLLTIGGHKVRNSLN